MPQERYEISEGTLIVRDEELGISLEGPFELPSLPSELTGAHSSVALVQHPDGYLERAFLHRGGVLHGQCRLFYPNGNVQGDCYYCEGELHGPSTFFGKKGEVLSTTWFFLGKQQGKVRQYYLSGQLYSLQRYKEGVWHGAQEYYYEDGILKTLMHYEAGQIHGTVSLRWPNGSPKRQCAFIKAKREGWDKIWNAKGIIIDEGEYRDGSPIGVHARRYNNGALMEERVYHTPERFDQKRWDEEGRVVLEGIYASDLSYVEKRLDPTTNEMTERRGRWEGSRLCWD
jgi:antitoxin component YwqK of YwqJK toxin-antitoxin module